MKYFICIVQLMQEHTSPPPNTAHAPADPEASRIRPVKRSEKIICAQHTRNVKILDTTGLASAKDHTLRVLNDYAIPR